MEPFSNLNLSGSPPISLIWKQPRLNEDYYELCDDPASDALYATIGWPKWLSDLAVARSAVGIWHFDRLGWTRRTIMVTRPVEPTANSGIENHPAFIPVASFEVGWFWEGDIVVNNGRIFHWYRTKTFRNSWALTEVISDYDVNHPTEKEDQDISTRIERKSRRFPFYKRSKPVRKERLVYEIEFGMRWLKQEAWITLPTYHSAHHPELVFLLCTGMYLGYCYNRDSAAVVAVCATAAVT